MSCFVPATIFKSVSTPLKCAKTLPRNIFKQALQFISGSTAQRDVFGQTVCADESQLTFKNTPRGKRDH